MNILNTKEQMAVNGGAAHYHWSCHLGGHSYLSSARNYASANAWRARHNAIYHGSNNYAKMSSVCNKNCGKVYTDMP